jgi:alginate biosynthesis protein Alg44
MDTNTAEQTPIETLPLQPLKGEHPMLDIPFLVGIDGRQFKGARLSLVMAEISGLMDPALAGTTRLMRFVFPFKGFSVTLEILGEIQAMDRDKGAATVSFVDPAGPHLPQLRHLMNSFIAGDLVALGEVIGVASTLPSPAARAAAKVAGRSLTFGRVIGTAGLLTATVLLVGAVGMLAYARIFTTPLDAAGLVTQDGLTLTAIAAGQVDYVNLDADPGEVAFTIRSSTGEMLSIAMPCDCSLTPMGAVVGATVQAGDPMLSVHAPDAPVLVTTQVPADLLLDLAFADHVTMEFADGVTVSASADPASLRAPSGAETVPVRLIPVEPLDPARAGQLAQLTVIKPVPFDLNTRIALYFN